MKVKRVKKLVSKKTKILMFIILISILLIYRIINITLATSDIENPNYIITIDQGVDGPVITHSGNLFGNELWYPGKQETGVIRIINNCDMKVRISKLGVIAELLSWKPGLAENVVMENFSNYMIFTIESKRLKLFPHTIIESEQLRELLYKEDDNQFNGITLDKEISINKNEYINLRYSLIMHQDAGKELENMQASVDLVIEFSEH